MLVIGNTMPFISLVQPLDKYLHFSDSLVTLSEEEGRSRVGSQNSLECLLELDQVDSLILVYHMYSKIESQVTTSKHTEDG